MWIHLRFMLTAVSGLVLIASAAGTAAEGEQSDAEKAIEKAEKDETLRHNLALIGIALKKYALKNAGKLPPNLLELVPQYVADKGVFKNPQLTTHAKGGVDFIYVPFVSAAEPRQIVVAGAGCVLLISGEVRFMEGDGATKALKEQLHDMSGATKNPFGGATVDQEKYKALCAKMIVPDFGEASPVDADRGKKELIAAYEDAAVAAMRLYCTSQVVFVKKKHKYASNMPELHSTKGADGKPLELVSKEMSEAYGERPIPWKGYVFREMQTIGGKKIDWSQDFALCATPAEYGKTGKLTFIVTIDELVLAKDLGKAQLLTDFPAQKEGWSITEQAADP